MIRIVTIKTHHTDIDDIVTKESFVKSVRFLGCVVYKYIYSYDCNKSSGKNIGFVQNSTK